MPKLIRRVAPPRLDTLRKYGLTVVDWDRMVREQSGVCPICRQPFGDRKLAIDHEHVKGFRARKHKRTKKGDRIKVRKMSPEERRRFVRGILHAYCNRMVRRWLTIELATNVLAYLAAYQERKNAKALGADAPDSVAGSRR